MVQILQPVPNSKTLRQRAFDEGLSNAASGFAGLMQGFENQQKTKRQQAFDSINTAIKLREAGYDVTPEQVQGMIPKEKSFFDSFLSSEEETQPQSVDVFSKRTPEYEQAKLDQARKRKLEELQIEDLSKPYQETREGKKFIEQERIRTQSDIDKKQKEKEIEEQVNPLGNLGGEDRNKVGSIATGLQALDEVKNAIESGYEPQYISSQTPIVGGLISDNPLTKAQRMVSEVVGRLQSGGAIGVEEEKRFNEMGPRAGDTQEIALQKIEDQKRFLENKLKAFRLNKEKLKRAGFEFNEQKTQVKNQPQQRPNKIIQNGIEYNLNPQTGEYE